MEKKHNYFYKITNLVNDKYYYGIHSTNKLNDRYMGSGYAMESAMKKYGRKNFTKEIVSDYPTRKEASDHERLVVTLELVKLSECYNLRAGGDKENAISEETKNKIREKRKLQIISPETRKKLSESHSGINHPMFGKTHSEESRKKMSESKDGKYCGEHSPSFGRVHSERSIQKMINSNKSKRPCKILGVVYCSVKEVSRKLEIGTTTIEHRLKSKSKKFKDWNYCEAMI